MKVCRQAFTLVEILVTIGILAVLATATTLVLNPAEYLARSRDSVRVSDIDTLNKSLSLFRTQGGSFTPADIVYISLPAPNQDCTGVTPAYVLPALPSGWVYRCANSDNLRKIDGTGWVPLDLTSAPPSPLGKLPLDPINSDSNQQYYTYIGGSWSLTARMESSKFLKDTNLSDGGNDPARYEAASDAKLWTEASGLAGYWPFDASANDASGNASNGTLVNFPANPWVSGQAGGALKIDGVDDYIDIPYNSNLALNNSFSVSFWVYLESDPDVGASNEWRVLMRKQTGSTSPFYMYLEQSRTINITAIKGGTSYRYIDNNFSSEQLAVGQWTHLAYTYDSAIGTGAAYKNSVLSRSGPMRNGSGGPAIPSGGLDATTTGWRISNYPGAYPPSSGAGSLPVNLDDFRVYSRALDASEIKSIYNSTK